MNPVPFTAVRPFEVWFKPDDGVRLPARVPLRIGERLLHYDDAMILAEASAQELPGYGIHTGSVLVLWSSSVLKVLNVLTVPPALIDAQTRSMTMAVATPRPEVVRLVLQDVQQLTSLSDPLQPAPAAWIERLHAVLRVIASPDDQVRFRLDGQQTVSMEALYRRVSGVLHRFDEFSTQLAPSPASPRRVVSISRVAD